MRITMVKKRLVDGRPCDKCAQSEEMLRRRGLWDAIDEVVWAQEGDETSPGAQLAQQHRVKIAPFFIVEAGPETEPIVVKSALKLVRDYLEQPADAAPRPIEGLSAQELPGIADQLAASEPQDVLRWGVERFGEKLGIQFTGGADVALVDMAARFSLPCRVFLVDTGRLHPETYAYVDDVRRHYGMTFDIFFPDAERVGALVRSKGQHSFRRDGHAECCAIRRSEPLGRALSDKLAWASAERADQLAPGAARRPSLQADSQWQGAGELLLRLNPLARWDAEQVWQYIHENAVPFNPLHGRGFHAIACEPCTRPIYPGQSESHGLWWWENGSEDETPPADIGSGI